MLIAIITFLLLRSLCCDAEETLRSPWHYECKGGQCQKFAIVSNTTSPLSLPVCQILCGVSGSLWPLPTGHVSLASSVTPIKYTDIALTGVSYDSELGDLLNTNVEKIKRNIKDLVYGQEITGGAAVIIHFDVEDEQDFQLTLNTVENYTLQIYSPRSNTINVTITSQNYFGARHALETLNQLIVYDDLRSKIVILSNAHIEDGPRYPYRGILLDTSRNFVDKATILRTIEAMGMSKLNTFHWHITDSHSFPYVSRTYPLLSKYGAYSPDKVYTEQDVKEIRHFGLLNGVRVLPEMDAPAHVGEGWQWVGDNATVCFKSEPWKNYCVEPPCGQLNPISHKTYEILQGIYSDMLTDFRPDIFHMGGDEVNLNCWKSAPSIKEWMIGHGHNLTDSNYYQLWNGFQKEAYKRLTKANNGTEIPAILWTSELTSAENLKYLDPKKYIIQIWTTAFDSTIKRLLQNEFKVIFSNYDSLYLDCGFGAWIGEGNNWCSPYKGWQKIYENSPLNILKHFELPRSTKEFILGAEATLWTEQAEGPAIDSKLWPRSAAMAERLWTEPNFSWVHAEQRFLWHRERLVHRGINADAQEPEWCQQNQGYCY